MEDDEYGFSKTAREAEKERKPAQMNASAVIIDGVDMKVLSKAIADDYPVLEQSKKALQKMFHTAIEVLKESGIIATMDAFMFTSDPRSESTERVSFNETYYLIDEKAAIRFAGNASIDFMLVTRGKKFETLCIAAWDMDGRVETDDTKKIPIFYVNGDYHREIAKISDALNTFIHDVIAKNPL